MQHGDPMPQCTSQCRLTPVILLVVCMITSAWPSFSLAQTLPQNDEPVLLTANELIYDTSARLLRARGDVEFSQGRQRLLADEVVYNLDAETVVATGNIVLIDADGNAAFAEEIELRDDLGNGFVRQIRILLADESRLAAVRGERSGGTQTTLDKAIYSPCEICEEDDSAPLWQIRAERVVHDTESKTVTYRNAVFEFFGVPVAYSPYFYHPDPTVKRKTGFLAPTFGSDTELGLTAEVPFFVNLAPNRDITLTPLFTSDEGILLGAEYRELQEFGSWKVEGALTRTSPAQSNPDDDADGKDTRGYIEAEGRFTPAETYAAGFDINLATDNTFLDRYSISNDDVLENRLFVERAIERDFWEMNAFAFQSLRENDDQDQIPIALPFGEASFNGEPTKLGGRWFSNASILGLTRTSGLDTRRLSAEIGWQQPYVGPIGDLWRLRLSARGDAYQTDGDPQTLSDEGGNQFNSRIVPTASLDWSWPLVGETGNWSHVIEPLTNFTFIPSNLNDDDIPNEDSIEFEFDETNLFEASRFTGIDRVESGAKVSYGMRFDSVGPEAWRISGVAGQSYRTGPNQLFPEGSGLDDSLSDYVGRIDIRPSELLDLSYRFRLSKDEFEFRRSDLKLGLGPPRLRFNLQYLKVSEEFSAGDPADDLDQRQELVAGVRLHILDNLAIGAQTRRDLEENETIANTFGLIYTNPCLVIVAGLERSFTTRGELEDETRFSVRLAFKNLGDFGTTNDFFSSDQ